MHWTINTPTQVRNVDPTLQLSFGHGTYKNQERGLKVTKDKFTNGIRNF